MVVDSTADFRGLAGNLAFSLSLYAGQMCTTPADHLRAGDGIATDQGRKGFGEVAAAIADATYEAAGAIRRARPRYSARSSREATLAAARGGARRGRRARLARARAPAVPQARVRTPLIVELARPSGHDLAECFGPVTFVVATDTAEHRLAFAATRETHGAITARCTRPIAT